MIFFGVYFTNHLTFPNVWIEKQTISLVGGMGGAEISLNYHSVEHNTHCALYPLFNRYEEFSSRIRECYVTVLLSHAQ